MKNFQLPRIDKDPKLKSILEKYSRLKFGDVWTDPDEKHKIACFDSSVKSNFDKIIEEPIKLAIHDPPYNMIAFKKKKAKKFVDWCKLWVDISFNIMDENSSFYVWLGADQKNHFEPFAEFIVMMKETGFTSKSFMCMKA